MATLTINGRKVTVDDSFRSLSPEQQNATVEEIAQSLGGAQQSDPVTTPKTDRLPEDAAGDVVKSAASGLARGAADLAGLPGTVGGYLESGIDFVKGKAYEAVTGEKPTDGFWGPSNLPNPLSGGSLRQAMAAATGGATDYQPKTTAGEYARTVGEFAPSAVAAPGTMVQKGLLATVPALASETAGQVTEGTAAEPYARVGGALVGGLAAAGRSPTAAKVAAKDAPTAETLKSTVDTAYQTLRDSGIAYHPRAYAQAVQNAAADLQKQGFRSSNAGTAYGLVDDLAKDFGLTRNFDDVNALVSSIGETARDLVKQGKNQEARAVEIIRDRLMQLEESAPITSRVPLNRDQLNRVRGEVRGLALRNIKERVLSEVAQNAGTYASGMEAGIRNGIGNLLRSKRGQQLFKGEERKALLEVVHGRKGLRTLSRFGFDVTKVSGNAAMLPWLGAAATAAGVGPIAAGGLAAAGTAAKVASPFFTGRALENVKAAIRSGKLRDNSALDAATAERLRVQLRRLLATESGVQSSQASVPDI